MAKAKIEISGVLETGDIFGNDLQGVLTLKVTNDKGDSIVNEYMIHDENLEDVYRTFDKLLDKLSSSKQKKRLKKIVVSKVTSSPDKSKVIANK